MPSRPWKALVILLLFVAASPPTRVVNTWIAEASRDGADSNGPRKSVQARARNRIGSPVRPDAIPAVASLASGKRRAQPASSGFALPYPTAPQPRGSRPDGPRLARLLPPPLLAPTRILIQESPPPP